MKIDGKYYRQVLLKNQMLPVTRRIEWQLVCVAARQRTCSPLSWDSSASSFFKGKHRTLSLRICGRLTFRNPDLNPVDCRNWGLTQERVYKIPVRVTSDMEKRLTDTRASVSQKNHRRSCWSIEKADTCAREGARKPLWTSSELNRLFSEPPTFYREK